jgi:hypothetical protein
MQHPKPEKRPEKSADCREKTVKGHLLWFFAALKKRVFRGKTRKTTGNADWPHVNRRCSKALTGVLWWFIMNLSIKNDHYGNFRRKK